MKYSIILTCFLVVQIQVQSQEKSDSCCISKKDLVGVWQRDSKRVGNGLQQNFRFYDDGFFDVNFSNSDEDARGIYGIKGKYRLVKDQLYLTIISKKIIEGGKIVPTGSNEDAFIFTIVGGTLKEVKENNPKELPDPIYIILHKDGHIELSNETYYKLDWEDLKHINIYPGSHHE